MLSAALVFALIGSRQETAPPDTTPATQPPVVFEAPRGPAADFFPVLPGSQWSYEETERGSRRRSVFLDEAEDPVLVGGKPAFVVATRVSGGPRQRTYYRIEGDQVFVVGYQPDQPLADPIPILQASDKRTDWVFTGETVFARDKVPMTMRGSARRVGMRTILGERRECLEVTLEATVAAAGNFALRNKQVAVYAKGIGLVEMKETGEIGERKYERTRKLVTFRLGP
jgi:hypothetical protein